ncbi:hypothetical protein [Nocardiopsis suaedae]|uniref:Uncharacterized protein n=1 Tax=Nocardiopsis suaedae TaxID=3018444 RepID=A0ABT4TLR3_9ACTN|nr:hypothetical protein [Nocardiopsis suaedae]MDA2805644.1 hypothetical protein [Nocardiopsis suaedae]
MSQGIHHRDSDRFPVLLNLLAMILLLACPALLALPSPNPHQPRHARGLCPAPEQPEQKAIARASAPTARRSTHTRSPDPDVPPDYDAFLLVHHTHRADWCLSYRSTVTTPYLATNRIDPEITVAATTLDALDSALTSFQRPFHVRPYIDCVRSW